MGHLKVHWLQMPHYAHIFYISYVKLLVSFPLLFSEGFNVQVSRRLLRTDRPWEQLDFPHDGMVNGEGKITVPHCMQLMHIKFIISATDRRLFWSSSDLFAYDGEGVRMVSSGQLVLLNRPTCCCWTGKPLHIPPFSTVQNWAIL